jgi:two-component system, NtrC family, sensor kinase
MVESVNRHERLSWLAGSVRNKLVAMALLPLLVVLPLLVLAVVMWGNEIYDRLLITKVRSDLAVAHGYFAHVLAEVGSGTAAVAESQALHQAIATNDTGRIGLLLERRREELGLAFLVLEPRAADDPPESTVARAARLRVMAPEAFARLVPHLAQRVAVPVIPTRNAAPSERTVEDRALVVIATAPVLGTAGKPAAVLRGGVLLNQNTAFIDHINQIVYPAGSLPFGSQGTATLFLDDVRVTTNVRLFQDQRAIGTRVSQAVSQAVLERGETWLDRAFVVNDWYVSAYEPLLDAQGKRVGMLYVGFLEKPFRYVMYAMLAAIGALFLAVMTLAAVFSLRLAHSIFQPVEKMNRTLQRVAAGDAGARVGPLSSRDEVGTLAAHLDHLLDVIDEKTRSLQRWADELDVKVAERTRELAAANASLVQAQRQLVKSEKLAAVGQLTASIAHEVNNPIAVIQGNLDLIREVLGEHAAPVAGEMRLMDEQVQRVRLIVTQLLQYARPTEYAGYVETLEPSRVLDECLILVGHLLASRRIAVRREFHATQRVGMNRQELQQVLVNLMINALQAMGEAGGTLTLRTLDWEYGALLEVQDSGPGFEEQALQQLFRPFFTTRVEGNGLGLWISQGLVERYGGHIDAMNAPQGGALLRVRLLANPEQALASSMAQEMPHPWVT